MKCPHDGIDLVRSKRQGIEIDYCPRCRGVWLDRGELDKIIERSTSSQTIENEDGEFYSVKEPRQVGDREYDHFGRRRRNLHIRNLFDFD